ncbi:MAG: DUF3467 domain-containing protein [Bacteroides sp.]|nr:DUF3467 domain-containing protein [Bacteroides sp.]
MEENNGQLQIELNDETGQGIYSNLAIITHSSSEFIVDFIRAMPGLPKAGVKSRIIIAPEHAKRLLWALEENIRKYELNYGAIRVPEEAVLPMLKKPAAEA